MSNPNSKHTTVVVQLDDWKEEIDEVLAPLIQEIWMAGISTVMSCQEVEPEVAWIEFPSIEELFRFLNLITRYEPGVDTLYNRILHQLTGPMSAPAWEYQLNLMDIFEGQEEQIIDGLACFDAMAGVYFPTSDIPVLLQRLRALNDVA
ncbi:MAG: hypothetical protein HQ581_21900 [Planctomycetes bacterium]|nr:hypothetical protein [Planctomycetota bacterium]